jgi:hypothetical protein
MQQRQPASVARASVGEHARQQEHRQLGERQPRPRDGHRSAGEAADDHDRRYQRQRERGGGRDDEQPS